MVKLVPFSIVAKIKIFFLEKKNTNVFFQKKTYWK